MPKPAKGTRLASGPDHEKLLLSGLAAALIRDERIKTTEAKAKRLRPVAERLITLGKDGSVHARRRALAVVEDRDVIHKLFSELAPRYGDRTGGYTRILKLGPRKGDAAPMALIELIETEAETPRATEEPEGRRRRIGRRRKAGIPEPEEAATEESEVVDEPVATAETASSEATEESSETAEVPMDSVKASEDAATVEDLVEPDAETEKDE